MAKSCTQIEPNPRHASSMPSWSRGGMLKINAVSLSEALEGYPVRYRPPQGEICSKEDDEEEEGAAATARARRRTGIVVIGIPCWGGGMTR